MSEIKIIPLPESDSDRDAEMMTLRITLPRGDYQKLNDFMNGDAWEKAQEIRKANLSACLKSLEEALNWALRHDCSGARVFATLLASLYNGRRVKMDVSDLALLDMGNFEHAMNVIRLCMETRREPHSFFVDGGELFEKMIKQWGFEKNRRVTR